LVWASAERSVPGGVCRAKDPRTYVRAPGRRRGPRPRAARQIPRARRARRRVPAAALEFDRPRRRGARPRQPAAARGTPAHMPTTARGGGGRRRRRHCVCGRGIPRARHPPSSPNPRARPGRRTDGVPAPRLAD